MQLQFEKSRKSRRVVDAYLRRLFQEITENTLISFDKFLTKVCIK